jgi:RimJ/RimL family protein N-acetyltransferase
MILRRAAQTDLAFVLDIEQRFARRGLILSDDADTHQRRMTDSDCGCFIVEEHGASVGYVILRGLTTGSGTIELQRIVIGLPGRGLGSRALRLVIDKVFQEYGARRLWLDVFQHNNRARHVYRKAGFIEEGLVNHAATGGAQSRPLVVMSIESMAAQEVR